MAIPVELKVEFSDSLAGDGVGLEITAIASSNARQLWSGIVFRCVLSFIKGNGSDVIRVCRIGVFYHLTRSWINSLGRVIHLAGLATSDSDEEGNVQEGDHHGSHCSDCG